MGPLCEIQKLYLEQASKEFIKENDRTDTGRETH